MDTFLVLFHTHGFHEDVLPYFSDFCHNVLHRFDFFDSRSMGEGPLILTFQSDLKSRPIQLFELVDLLVNGIRWARVNKHARIARPGDPRYCWCWRQSLLSLVRIQEMVKPDDDRRFGLRFLMCFFIPDKIALGMLIGLLRCNVLSNFMECKYDRIQYFFACFALSYALF